MNISEKLSSKLKLLRESRNYTQQFVADQLEISPNTYSLIERSQAPLSLDRLQKLADLYEINLIDLIAMADQTIIHHIANSNNVGGSENINILHAGIAEEERNLYKETIKRLEEQNQKLLVQIELQNDKLMALIEKISVKF